MCDVIGDSSTMETSSPPLVFQQGSILLRTALIIDHPTQIEHPLRRQILPQRLVSLLTTRADPL
jgi:hypothetical protein